MSHENIVYPDDRPDWRDLEASKLQAELAFFKQRYESVCDDLRSICDRAIAGERVYFVLRSGEKVELVREEK